MEPIEIQSEEKKRIIAAKKVFVSTHTKSFNKLEKIIANDEASRMQRVTIAFFAYVHKNSKLNPLKHPNLLKLSKDFELALNKASEEDEYFKFFKRVESSENYRSKARDFKMKAVEITNKALKDTNTSINTMAEATGIKYSNLYNFLVNEKYSELSPRKTHELLVKAKTLREGWGDISMDETYSKMLDKWGKLEQYLIEQEGEKNDK